jgi:hypothetical protein
VLSAVGSSLVILVRHIDMQHRISPIVVVVVEATSAVAGHMVMVSGQQPAASEVNEQHPLQLVAGQKTCQSLQPVAGLQPLQQVVGQVAGLQLLQHVLGQVAGLQPLQQVVGQVAGLQLLQHVLGQVAGLQP